jgi:hypothetical protein
MVYKIEDADAIPTNINSSINPSGPKIINTRNIKNVY